MAFAEWLLGDALRVTGAAFAVYRVVPLWPLSTLVGGKGWENHPGRARPRLWAGGPEETGAVPGRRVSGPINQAGPFKVVPAAILNKGRWGPATISTMPRPSSGRLRRASAPGSPGTSQRRIDTPRPAPRRSPDMAARADDRCPKSAKCCPRCCPGAFLCIKSPHENGQEMAVVIGEVAVSRS